MMSLPQNPETALLPPPTANVALLFEPDTSNDSPASSGLRKMERRESKGLGAPDLPRRAGFRNRGHTPAEPWLAMALASRWEIYGQRLEDFRQKATVETVHELRVALRRLLSQVGLLSCICPDRKTERIRRELKRQLELLGALRDIHVQREFVLKQEVRYPELILLRRYLDRLERKLLKLVRRDFARVRTGRLGRYFRALATHCAAAYSGAREQRQLARLCLSRTAAAFAATVARRRLIQFLNLGTIHRTRVAFKKFRYLVEALPSGITGLSKQDLRELARYQRRMGNIQDLQVVQKSVSEFVAGHPGTGVLLRDFCAYLKSRRVRALRSFRKSADRLFSFWPPPALSGTCHGSLERNGHPRRQGTIRTKAPVRE